MKLYIFFRETEKSFREISGKGPDEKNYCIIGFPGVRGKFPGNFPRVSGKISLEQKFFLHGAAARSQGPDAPKGIQMHGHPFDAADNWRIWYQGSRARLASLRLEDNSSLRIPGAPVSATNCGLSRRVRSPILLAR